MEMSAENKQVYDDCSFVSIHYIICECGETFPSENGLRAHLEKEHPHKREKKEFKCGVCGSIFSLEEECIAHYEEVHFEETETEVKQECSDEDTIPETTYYVDVPEHQQEQLVINYHENQNHKYILHEETGLVQMSSEDMAHEEIAEEVMSQDEELSQEVTSQEEESQDVTSHAAAAQDETTRATQMLVKAHGTKQYPEPVTPAIKMVRDADTGQLVLVFQRPARNKPTKTNQGKRNLRSIVCEVCGGKYASNAALKYHQRVHSGERPYRCEWCPKAFTMPLFLQIHIRTHTGEKPYQCTECPKAFSNRAALLRHERVHTGEKPYTCPMCLKSFTQSNSMKLHVATVHLKQPAPYKSKTRRAKEQGRTHKGPIKQQKIQAFAPSTTRNVERTNSDGEYEVIISEEVQDQEENYEIVYETT